MTTGNSNKTTGNSNKTTGKGDKPTGNDDKPREIVTKPPGKGDQPRGLVTDTTGNSDNPRGLVTDTTGNSDKPTGNSDRQGDRPWFCYYSRGFVIIPRGFVTIHRGLSSFVCKDAPLVYEDYVNYKEKTSQRYFWKTIDPTCMKFYESIRSTR